MKAGVKAGKLANGFERDRGKVIHALPTNFEIYDGPAVCGAQPKITWNYKLQYQINCPKCRKLIHAKG